MTVIRAFLFSLAVALYPLCALATINTSTSSTLVLGTGAQTVFTFNFIGVATSDVNVLYTDAAGNQTQLTQGPGPTQYQVTLANPVQGATWGIGGTVTYNPGGTPIPVGSTLTIYRTLALTQSVSLQNQASYGQYAKSAEQGLDLLALKLQQVNNTIGRAIVANPANASFPLPLPPAAQMANQLLCGDGTGLNVVACTAPASGLISTAMQPVVNAATLAAGRTALGLGTLATEGLGAGLQDDGAGNVRVDWTILADAINTNVTSAFHMKQHSAFGPFTYTLPRANTLWNGFGFWIYPSNDVITLAIDSHDNFNGQASGVAAFLNPGQPVFLTTDGASAGVWYASLSAAPNIPGIELVNTQAGTTYTVVALDDTKLISLTNTATVAVSIPQATNGAGAFPPGFWFFVQNKSSSLVTLTPTVSTINGNTNLILPKGTGVKVVSDGANWQVEGVIPSQQGKWLLNTVTASTSATISDLTSFSTGFKHYEVVLDDILPVTASTSCQIQVHTGGVFQSTVYVSTGVIVDPAGVTGYGSITNSIPCSYPGGTSNSLPGVSGSFIVENPAQTTAVKVWRGHSAYRFPGQGITVDSSSGYWNGGNGAIDGFQVLFNSGSIASGSVSVYGFN